LNAAAFPMMIFPGHPNFERMLVSKNLMITTSVDFLVGTSSIHLVK